MASTAIEDEPRYPSERIRARRDQGAAGQHGICLDGGRVVRADRDGAFPDDCITDQSVKLYRLVTCIDHPPDQMTQGYSRLNQQVSEINQEQSTIERTATARRNDMQALGVQVQGLTDAFAPGEPPL
jgi:hypothetical protein